MEIEERTRGSMAPLLLLLLLLGALPASTRAQAAPEVLNVAVGQLFSYRLPEADRIPPDGLPAWMGFDPAQNTLYGVPKWARLENVTLRTEQGRQLEVNTFLELELCPQGSFVFIERYENKDFDSYRPEDLR